MKRLCSLLFLLLIDAATAHADSDGYYCVGPDYIAYQFLFTDPPAGTHRLHIVRFGNGTLSEPVSFTLPEFQVGQLRCRADAVDLAAWQAIHTVALDSLRRPVRMSTTPLPVAGPTPDWGGWWVISGYGTVPPGHS